eukprot:scaffold173183_cov29-Tisochrysis_lutea.AAC.1
MSGGVAHNVVGSRQQPDYLAIWLRCGSEELTCKEWSYFGTLGRAGFARPGDVDPRREVRHGGRGAARPRQAVGGAPYTEVRAQDFHASLLVV